MARSPHRLGGSIPTRRRRMSNGAMTVIGHTVPTTTPSNPIMGRARNVCRRITDQRGARLRECVGSLRCSPTPWWSLLQPRFLKWRPRSCRLLVGALLLAPSPRLLGPSIAGFHLAARFRLRWRRLYPHPHRPGCLASRVTVRNGLEAPSYATTIGTLVGDALTRL